MFLRVTQHSRAGHNEQRRRDTWWPDPRILQNVARVVRQDKDRAHADEQRRPVDPGKAALAPSPPTRRLPHRERQNGSEDDEVDDERQRVAEMAGRCAHRAAQERHEERGPASRANQRRNRACERRERHQQTAPVIRRPQSLGGLPVALAQQHRVVGLRCSGAVCAAALCRRLDVLIRGGGRGLSGCALGRHRLNRDALALPNSVCSTAYCSPRRSPHASASRSNRSSSSRLRAPGLPERALECSELRVLG